MAHLAVQRDALDRPVGDVQDAAARGLVEAAVLHADEAVLDQVEPADAVGAAELVEPGEHGGRAQALAVDRHGVALLEADLVEGRLVYRTSVREGKRG